MNITITFNDEGGFISQKCPSCSGTFKAEQVKGSDKEVSFCPYCRRQGREWWTKQQADYIESVLASKVLKPQMDKMMRGFNSRGSSGIRVTATASYPRVLSAPHEPQQGWAITTYECCGERLRLDPEQKASFCPICGKESASQPIVEGAAGREQGDEK